jgi:heme-degrading monooxygenase HmoA
MLPPMQCLHHVEGFENRDLCAARQHRAGLGEFSRLVERPRLEDRVPARHPVRRAIADRAAAGYSLCHGCEWIAGIDHGAGIIAPEKLDEAVRLWQGSALPSVRQKKGFKSVRLLVDRASGKIASLGLWETEADFQATVGWNQGQVAKFGEFFSAPPEVGGYEVVVEVGAEE